MAESEVLVISEGKRPETSDGRVGCVMLFASGRGVDDQGNEIQFFDYRPGFFAEIIQVRWDKGTMHVVLPDNVSDYLLRNGYARVMTSKEADSYNKALMPAEVEQEPPAEPASERPSRKKERTHDRD
ncbi:hypothetical protein [Bradyrhizobium sp. USDA 4508]